MTRPGRSGDAGRPVPRAVGRLGMLAIAAAALTMGACARKATPVVPAHPNIVFVLTDDQRWDAISLNPKSGPLKTPNIDRLGHEGVYFRNAFATTALCSPSRATIQTGEYAHIHGVTNNFTEFPDDAETWPRDLQKIGYETAYVGKYHMGEDNDAPRPGFDYFATHRGQGDYYGTEWRINGGERHVIPGYYTTIVTDLAEQWIRGRTDGKPWAIMIGHKAPHSFYVPEDKYKNAFADVHIPYPPSAFMLDDKPEWYKERLPTWHGIYGPLFTYRKNFPDRSPEGVTAFEEMIRSYWRTILSVDDSVGRIYALLQQLGELDNTIFIFTSDHGLLDGEHGMVDKRTAHEPTIRVPLVVRYPGLTPPTQPRVVDQMVLTTDFAPSILDMVGLPAGPKMQGRSWKSIAQGHPDSTWRTSYVYMYNYEKQFPYTPNVRALRTSEWKYVRYPNSPKPHMAELYHLTDDPDEIVNLINDPRYRYRVEQMHAELDQQLIALGAWPDKMPLDEGIGQELPEESIR
ncbi:MAG TPA: sulfatase [Vicinamibacterales bacterium]|nr:sulfatase [Vicinamibacterales bacterium]